MNPGWRNNYLRYKSYFLNVVGRYRERADIKVYLEILLSLATVSLFSVFALRPTLLTIAELIKEIEAKQETLATMEEKIRNISVAQSLYDRERSKILILESAIPTNAEPIVFARQIEGLSAKHTTSILSLSTGGAMILGEQTSPDANDSSQEKQKLMPDGSGEFSFLVKAKVSSEEYDKISNFISDFENLRRPSLIDTLKIESTEDKSEEAQKGLSMTIEGRLPFYTVEEEK